MPWPHSLRPPRSWPRSSRRGPHSSRGTPRGSGRQPSGPRSSAPRPPWRTCATCIRPSCRRRSRSSRRVSGNVSFGRLRAGSRPTSGTRSCWRHPSRPSTSVPSRQRPSSRPRSSMCGRPGVSTLGSAWPTSGPPTRTWSRSIPTRSRRQGTHWQPRPSASPGAGSRSRCASCSGRSRNPSRDGVARSCWAGPRRCCWGSRSPSPRGSWVRSPSPIWLPRRPLGGVSTGWPAPSSAASPSWLPCSRSSRRGRARSAAGRS